MATLTQDAVVQLIMRYIGGSRLVPSDKLDIKGLKVPTQATSLAGVAAALKQFGTTADQVRTSVLQNPKVAQIQQAGQNISTLRNLINSH